jgi:predicted nucleotidyltransferase
MNQDLGSAPVLGRTVGASPKQTKLTVALQSRGQAHILEQRNASVKGPESPVATAMPILRKQWSRFPVKRAWLFGSRSAARGQTASDWDFLVKFSHSPSFDEFMGLKEGLQEGLHARVDLLSRWACAPRFLKAIEEQSDRCHVTGSCDSPTSSSPHSIADYINDFDEATLASDLKTPGRCHPPVRDHWRGSKIVAAGTAPPRPLNSLESDRRFP